VIELNNRSGGHAIWNVVTLYYGEENFGDGKLLPLVERYREADKYMQVANRLWSGSVSWSDDGHRFDGDIVDETTFVRIFPRGASARHPAGAAGTSRHCPGWSVKSSSPRRPIWRRRSLLRRAEEARRNSRTGSGAAADSPRLNILVAPTASEAEAI